MTIRLLVSTASRTTHHAGRRGYSAIEVMVAISLLAIASTGIFALQKVTITGNGRAKNLATASQIARTWIERLRSDAASWNYPAASHPNVVCSGAVTPGCISGTTWLRNVSTPNLWFKPATVVGRGGAAFDALGNDVTDSGAPVAFCTHARLNWLYPDDLVRAEIRVFWLKEGGEGPLGGTLCAEAAPNTLGTAASLPLARYHFAYFTTSVAITPAP